MRPARHLVIMARQPRAGAVKTRLAADIGPAAAAAVYRHLLARTLRTLAPDRRWRTLVAVSPDAAVADFRRRGLNAIPQGPGDLGRRMDRIMHSAPPGPVVIVGSDIADINRGDIARAFKCFRSMDVALGPAADGGYWLVGLKRFPRIPAIFDHVRWSTPHALADTLCNAAALNVAMLHQRTDIDTGEDWRRLLASGGLRL